MAAWVLIGFHLLLLVIATAIVARLTLVMVFAHKHLPFVPTSKRVARAMVNAGDLQQKSHIIDLGAGTGTLLAILHREIPNATLRGVEHSRLLVALARLRFTTVRAPRPVVSHGDMFQADISQADAIVGFWISALTPALLRKFEEECPPGTVVVSNLFPLPPSDRFTEERVQVGKNTIWVYKKR